MISSGPVLGTQLPMHPTINNRESDKLLGEDTLKFIGKMRRVMIIAAIVMLCVFPFIIDSEVLGSIFPGLRSNGTIIGELRVSSTIIAMGLLMIANSLKCVVKGDKKVQVVAFLGIISTIIFMGYCIINVLKLDSLWDMVVRGDTEVANIFRWLCIWMYLMLACILSANILLIKETTGAVKTLKKIAMVGVFVSLVPGIVMNLTVMASNDFEKVFTMNTALSLPLWLGLIAALVALAISRNAQVPSSKPGIAAQVGGIRKE